jgi:hypothetical protein
MVSFNSSFEVLLFSEKFNLLQNKWEDQNSWNMLVLNPTTMLCGSFYIISGNSWWLIINIKERQQVSLSLPFASPWAKLISTMDQELLQCFHASKYTCVQTRILLRIRANYSNFKLTCYLQLWSFWPSLGSWVIERQNNQVKRCVSSSSINLHSGFL